MKKLTWLTIVIVIALMLGSIGTAYAQIIPPKGFGQIGLSGEILCEELTLREKPGFSSKAIETLKYGDLIIVTEEKDGWARVVLGDAENSPSGWVNAEYIVIDPAYYQTDEKTPVYAWNDTSAPKVALLDKNTAFPPFQDPSTYLPILKDEGDWVLVSLRGAVGWIHKTSLDLSSAE